MNAKEMKSLVVYLEDNVTKHETEYFDEKMNNFVTKPSVAFDELIKLLSNYPIEEPKECCGPNYEAMYTDAMTKLELQKAEIKGLKNEKCILEHKLELTRGAIAMVETIYGRRWSPGTLELIR